MGAWMQIIQKILQRVGGFGGDVMAAQQIYNKADQARQADLLRRQEMGALGLTDEEIGVLRERTVAPVQSAMREQNLRAMASAPLTDASGGNAARMRMANEDRATRNLAEVGKGVAEANEAARQSQENELLDLAKAKENKKAAIWGAVFNNLVSDKGNGDSFTDIGNSFQQGRADKEDENAIYAQQSGVKTEDTGMVTSLMSSFGG